MQSVKSYERSTFVLFDSYFLEKPRKKWRKKAGFIYHI